MGSSGIRKARRKRDDDNGSSFNGAAPVKKVKTGRGRSDYRNVTRTARRGPAHTDAEEQVEEESEKEEESDSEDEEVTNIGDDLDKGKAYDALLTLLNAEQDLEESEEEDEEEQNEEENEQDEESEVEEEEKEGEIAGVVEAEAPDADESDEEAEDDSDDENLADPFEYHFGNSSEKYLEECSSALKTTNRWKNSKKSFDTHSCIISLPPVNSSSKFSEIPQDHSLENYNIKARILEPFKNKNGEEATNNEIADLILDPMFSYKDVLLPYADFKNQEHYRKLYSLHCLNHVFKTRDRILKNNTRITIQNENITSGKLKPEDEKEFRDQGFTRPKVLILLPTRNHCYKVVQEMLKISGADQIENQKKFKAQFYEDSAPPENKPEDFQDLFEGNNNDFFCLGMKFTRKSVKLYSSFYQSDIILASPIGLQLILENPDKKKRQTDFLSSIEVMVVDNANAIELQNWDHILTVLKYVNKIPSDFHDTDFGRVRMWSINEQAQFFRQTLVFTEYNTPNINNILSKSENIYGKYRFRKLVSNDQSAMFKVGLKIKQIFTRYESTSPMDEPDARFNHFKNVIVPSLSKSTTYEDGLLLFIPSYTDFLRIKNYLHNKTSLLFIDANEYSEQKDLTKARALFQQGRRKILLYTERLHHYRRFDLKGVKNIFMYGVPNNPIFYSELVSSIGRSVYEGVADFNISTVRVLYSKWDALSLERVVGSERAPVLTHGQNEFYEFR